MVNYYYLLLIHYLIFNIHYLDDIENNENKYPSKIIILAHSIGGMVARTAMILTNHPHCVVNSIIMLSTPNSRYFLSYFSIILSYFSFLL